MKASLELHTQFQIDAVDDRIFGGFIEHLGRCVYQGVYEPDHPLSDANGLRADLRDALKELGVTVVRYPGGNFVSGYHWEDGVGVAEARRTVRELAWQSIEPNWFGTDEFIQLCRSLNWQPMLAVNLGTGTPEEARNWVEYCNALTGTYFADQRAKNGNEEPFDVPLWCLGNEMDGPWQLGHVPVDEYCNRAQMAAKMMTDCDPRVELVACGSSGPQMPTFIEWDHRVMQRMGSRLANYISLHRYVGNRNEDSADYLAISNAIDNQIESVDATARAVAGQSRDRRRTYLCFDEWNVWYRARTQTDRDGTGRVAPVLLDETYNYEDALVVAMFLMSFIRHADAVKIANLAQLVNVIAPLKTNPEGILKQSTFHPFRMISSRKGGTALQQAITCDTYASESYGTVTYLDSATILEESTLKVFALNRHLEEAMTLTVNCADRPILEFTDGELLSHTNLQAENSWRNASEITPASLKDIKLDAGKAHVDLPPQSFAAVSFQLG
ncbi:MAG: alpha-N-arabinofuranosidase [Gammaproteobacteria bacterium]|nr:alpha-N-arabinofuranosidase [Gammaproteobacteria bacterium]